MQDTKIEFEWILMENPFIVWHFGDVFVFAWVNVAH